MKLLAFDTALEACSVGVMAEGAIVLRSEVIGRGHQERLFPMIEAAMAEAELTFAALDRIAVTTGPGSFAGIRVGLAAARGFALVTGKPLIGLTTLAVHAESARDQLAGRVLLVAIDARKNEIYGQMFGPDLAPMSEAAVGSAAEFARMAEAAGAMLAGSGAEMVAAAMGGDAAAGRILHRAAAPDIGTLLRMAVSAPAPAARPKPLYIRPPDAKPRAAIAGAAQ